jgi:hypothetical protein
MRAGYQQITAIFVRLGRSGTERLGLHDRRRALTGKSRDVLKDAKISCATPDLHQPTSNPRMSATRTTARDLPVRLRPAFTTCSAWRRNALYHPGGYRNRIHLRHYRSPLTDGADGLRPRHQGFPFSRSGRLIRMRTVISYASDATHLRLGADGIHHPEALDVARPYGRGKMFGSLPPAT